MEPVPRDVQNYETPDGCVPFEEWLNKLKDVTARAMIRKRITRVRVGNLGTNRNLGDGVWELKINFGPGYRVYYAEDGPVIVVLLCGGDKGSQDRDITKAKEYWKEFCS